jgi:hypothetical protein
MFLMNLPKVVTLDNENRGAGKSAGEVPTTLRSLKEEVT